METTQQSHGQINFVNNPVQFLLPNLSYPLKGIIGPALLLGPELLIVRLCVVNELLVVRVDHLLAAVSTLRMR